SSSSSSSKSEASRGRGRRRGRRRRRRGRGRGRRMGHQHDDLPPEPVPDQRFLLWLLGALVVAIPAVGLPTTGVWLTIRAFAVEAVATVAAMFVYWQGEWPRARVRHALLAPPNLAILGFLVWAGISALRSDLPAISHYQFMR